MKSFLLFHMTYKFIIRHNLHNGRNQCAIRIFARSPPPLHSRLLLTYHQRSNSNLVNRRASVNSESISIAYSDNIKPRWTGNKKSQPLFRQHQTQNCTGRHLVNALLVRLLPTFVFFFCVAFIALFSLGVMVIVWDYIHRDHQTATKRQQNHKSVFAVMFSALHDLRTRIWLRVVFVRVELWAIKPLE